MSREYSVKAELEYSNKSDLENILGYLKELGDEFGDIHTKDGKLIIPDNEYPGFDTEVFVEATKKAKTGFITQADPNQDEYFTVWSHGVSASAANIEDIDISQNEKTYPIDLFLETKEERENYADSESQVKADMFYKAQENMKKWMDPTSESNSLVRFCESIMEDGKLQFVDEDGLAGIYDTTSIKTLIRIWEKGIMKFDAEFEYVNDLLSNMKTIVENRENELNTKTQKKYSKENNMNL